MSTQAKICDGCGKPASCFQCPLCQAKLITDRGFFCNQECFAKQWLIHRNTFHKKGVVRAKQPPQPSSIELSGGRRKRLLGEAKQAGELTKKKKKQKIEEVEPAKLVIVPWCPLPFPKCGTEAVTPAVSPGIPRVLVGSLSTNPRVAFWSAAFAASHHIVAEFEQSDGSVPLHVLVIAASPLAAHAMAWALRSAGLGGAMRLVVSSSEEDMMVDPSTYFCGCQRIVITTQGIARRVADGSVSAWLSTSNSLIVTLPGVVDAGDFQAVHTRAVFFVCRHAGKGTLEDSWCAEEEIKHNVSPLSQCPVELHHFFDGSTTSSSTLSYKQAEVASNEESAKFDNHISTSLSRGDLFGALQHLVRLYSTKRGIFEEVLVNSFLSSLGAASVAHFHHMLAYVVRHLVDHSSRFLGPQGGTLKEMALRAVARVVRLLEPIAASGEGIRRADGTEEGCTSTDISANGDASKRFLPPSALEKKRVFNYYESLPNLQLQATICYLYDHAPLGILDSFCMAWGVSKVLQGLGALKVADQKREEAVKRLQNRYGSKLGPAFANYLVVLMHFLYDAVAGYSLAVEDIERRTLWSMTLAGEVGNLRSFLSNCFLLQKDVALSTKSTKGKTASLSSRQVPKKTPSRTELLRALPVRTAVAEEALTLTWATVPLLGRRQREVKQMHQQAVEEILMAMPRKPRPMYIGDVGNLIGKWLHFNARFDGVLGVTLLEFLMQHPEAFRVVGNLVTRRTAGASEPVKIRFDQVDSDDDDKNDIDTNRERKAKDRALLTGAKNTGGRNAKDLSGRMRKKAAAKALNKARFNRNYKSIDASAKVPGYVKHGLRRVKGRGRKVNKRTTKRG